MKSRKQALIIVLNSFLLVSETILSSPKEGRLHY